MTDDTKFHHGDTVGDVAPIVEMKNIEKHFGNIIALAGVSFEVKPGECHCLLGDNGAGKSTFIKTMSGVHKPTKGEIYFEGKPLHFDTPRDAMEAGIATVFQDLAMIPLMSVTRNFFMGREPTKGKGLFKRFDVDHANEICMEKMRKMGINLRGPDQAVGTLSGGERQTVAIARAVHFGAKILILDEPTSALGVRQTSNVLATIDNVRNQGIGVVFHQPQCASCACRGRPLHGVEPGQDPRHSDARRNHARRAAGPDGRWSRDGPAGRLFGRHCLTRCKSECPAGLGGAFKE